LHGTDHDYLFPPSADSKITFRSKGLTNLHYALYAQQGLHGRHIFFAGGSRISAYTRLFSKEAWRLDEPYFVAPPPVMSSNRLVFASAPGRLKAVEVLSGASAWSYQTDQPVHSFHADNQALYVISQAPEVAGDFRLDAVSSPRGEGIWSQPLGKEPLLPIALSRRHVLVQSEAGLLRAFDKQSSVIDWQQTIAGKATALGCLDDLVIVTTDRGALATFADQDGDATFAAEPTRRGSPFVRPPGSDLPYAVVGDRTFVIGRNVRPSALAFWYASGASRILDGLGGWLGVGPGDKRVQFHLSAANLASETGGFEKPYEWARVAWPLRAPVNLQNEDATVISLSPDEARCESLHYVPGGPRTSRLSSGSHLLNLSVGDVAMALVPVLGAGLLVAILGRRESLPPTGESSSRLLVLLAASMVVGAACALAGATLVRAASVSGRPGGHLTLGLLQCLPLAALVLWGPVVLLNQRRRVLSLVREAGDATTHPLSLVADGLRKEMGITAQVRLMRLPPGARTLLTVPLSPSKAALLLPPDIEQSALAACQGDPVLARGLVRFVLAHELAHLRHRDLLVLPWLIAFRLPLALAVFSVVAAYLLVPVRAEDIVLRHLAWPSVALLLSSLPFLRLVLHSHLKEREHAADAAASLYVDPGLLESLCGHADQDTRCSSPLGRFSALLNLPQPCAAKPASIPARWLAKLRLQGRSPRHPSHGRWTALLARHHLLLSAAPFTLRTALVLAGLGALLYGSYVLVVVCALVQRSLLACAPGASLAAQWVRSYTTAAPHDWLLDSSSGWHRLAATGIAMLLACVLALSLKARSRLLPSEVFKQAHSPTITIAMTVLGFLALSVGVDWLVVPGGRELPRIWLPGGFVSATLVVALAVMWLTLSLFGAHDPGPLSVIVRLLAVSLGAIVALGWAGSFLVPYREGPSLLAWLLGGFSLAAGLGVLPVVGRWCCYSCDSASGAEAGRQGPIVWSGPTPPVAGPRSSKSKQPLVPGLLTFALRLAILMVGILLFARVFLPHLDDWFLRSGARSTLTSWCVSTFNSHGVGRPQAGFVQFVCVLPLLLAGGAVRLSGLVMSLGVVVGLGFMVRNGVTRSRLPVVDEIKRLGGAVVLADTLGIGRHAAGLQSRMVSLVGGFQWSIPSLLASETPLSLPLMACVALARVPQASCNPLASRELHAFLLQCEAAGGGFSPLPGGEPSLAHTAAALGLLRQTTFWTPARQELHTAWLLGQAKFLASRNLRMQPYYRLRALRALVRGLSAMEALSKLDPDQRRVLGEGAEAAWEAGDKRASDHAALADVLTALRIEGTSARPALAAYWLPGALSGVRHMPPFTATEDILAIIAVARLVYGSEWQEQEAVVQLRNTVCSALDSLPPFESPLPPTGRRPESPAASDSARKGLGDLAREA
jgi:hypothetical protein